MHGLRSRPFGRSATSSRHHQTRKWARGRPMKQWHLLASSVEKKVLVTSAVGQLSQTAEAPSGPSMARSLRSTRSRSDGRGWNTARAARMRAAAPGPTLSISSTLLLPKSTRMALPPARGSAGSRSNATVSANCGGLDSKGGKHAPTKRGRRSHRRQAVACRVRIHQKICIRIARAPAVGNRIRRGAPQSRWLASHRIGTVSSRFDDGFPVVTPLHVVVPCLTIFSVAQSAACPVSLF